MTKCRICGCNSAISIGTYKPYLDYECVVFDCTACGCRFVNRDDAVYEKLHSAPSSSYSFHEELALKIHEYFRTGNLQALGNELRQTPKFRFVIDTIERQHNALNLLEFGCSKGYLTAYFIANKQQILGVDVSLSAIRTATELFGQYFGTLNSPQIQERSPYDVIYHVGTIGCVESPIELTRYLLSLLKPGGALLFNVPNVNACKESGALWVRGTPPPDLVTLFPPEFWQGQFSDLADVKIVYEPVDEYTATKIAFRRLLGITQLPKATTTLVSSQSVTTQSRSGRSYFTIRAMKGSLRCIVGFVGKPFVFPKYSSESGLHVTMIKKSVVGE